MARDRTFHAKHPDTLTLNDDEQVQQYDRLAALLVRPAAYKKSAEDERARKADKALFALRKNVLLDGIPEIEGRASLRGRMWKLMLGVDQLHSSDYLKWVAKGESIVRSKIKNDTFRTLATDTEFRGKVKEDMLIRLLDAFVWKNEETEKDGGLPFTYVQGMNVLSAPFLYVMPTQLEAFECFTKFIEQCCPLYVQPTLVGVHRGLRLLDRCLEHVDNELYRYLRSKNLSAELYAFPSVMTLCACTPPLEEVLKLWDFLLTFGVHLNILCVAAQLVLMKDELLVTPSPMKRLRTFPPFDAHAVIRHALVFAADLPDDLYTDLVHHPRIS